MQALIEVNDELKAEHLTVITDDEDSILPIECPSGRTNINVIPLWKWLLMKNTSSLES